MAVRKAGRLAVRSAGLSDTGRVRQDNEDTFWLDPQGELYLLADGMSGHLAGKESSQMAIELFRQVLCEPVSQDFSWGEELERAILLVHARLQELSRRDLRLHRMGTTLLVARYAGPNTLWIGHVGNSRAYRLRANHLRQLTEDHTVFNQVRKSKRVAGEILDPALKHHLSQAVGCSEFLAPQILRVKIEPGDRYVLCSDGLPDMLTDAEIEALLSEPLDAAQLCQALVAAANQRGGKDNITVIVMLCTLKA